MIAIRRHAELETIFLLAMVAAGSLFFVVYKNNNYKMFNINSSNSSVLVPTEVLTPEVTTSSQISPDGTKKVIMKTTQDRDGTKIYDFFVSDENVSNEKHIFTKTLDSLSSMSIPFNTWSPDDKYFFIQGNISGSKNVLVFSAMGVPFAEKEPYLEAVNLFNQKNTGNNFDEATGWASETLIIINTKKQDNTKGQSYWFEIPSKAIIPLSTEF